MGFSYKFKKSNLFKEFSKDEQKQYFNLTEKNYIHHIDTFYYSVFLKGDIKEDEEKGHHSPEGIPELFDFLKTAKDVLSDYDKDAWIDFDKSLLLRKKRFKIYDYCIGKEGFYDIFFCSYLPNDSTPRIIIQLRSIGLWTVGEYELIQESYNVLEEFLADYDLEILRTQENRIDYCYHTNCLQSPEKFYSDECLKNNCYTNLSIYQKVGRKHGKQLDIEYLSFGQRTSNNIFFRSYNKVREVIEENYKEFFLELWFNSKMISYYDFYVYSYAYKKSSYSQIYVGMMEFYLEFGKDNFIKDKLNALKQTKYTIQQVKDIILKVCPVPTMVINIEFQTMRKFYYLSLELDSLPITTECREFSLLRLYQILDCRKLFLDYLTETTISFNKKDGSYMDFWQRLRSCKIEKNVCGEFTRQYAKNINRDIIVHKIKSNLATLSLYDGNWNTDINDDMSQLICVLNDNDTITDKDGICTIIDEDYNKIKEKRKKALKSVLGNLSPSKNNK